MRRAIATSVRLFSEIYGPRGPVVELGSYYPPGYEELCNLRPLFSQREYIGCDLRPGNGVDRIESAESLTFADKSIGTLLFFEILEHLPNPHQAVAEARRVLRDDGLLALSVPFNYRLHGFPSDYWRFTASGIHQLLSQFPEKTVFALGPRMKPSIIFAVAGSSDSSEFRAATSRFEAAVRKTFDKSLLRGFASVFKERSRDYFGLLLGRADLSVSFYDPAQPRYYVPQSEKNLVSAVMRGSETR
jgi:SAM-dependent methyltransferase